MKLKRIIVFLLCISILFVSTAVPVVHADVFTAGLVGYKVAEIIGAIIVYFASSGIILDSVEEYESFFYQRVQSSPEVFQSFAQGAFDAKDDQELLSRIKSRGSARGYHITSGFSSLARTKIDEIKGNYETNGLNIERIEGNSVRPLYSFQSFDNVFFNFRPLNLPVLCRWSISHRTDIDMGRYVENRDYYFSIVGNQVVAGYTEDYLEPYYQIPDLPGYTWSLIDLNIPLTGSVQRNEDTQTISNLRSLCLAGTYVDLTGKVSTKVIAMSDIWNMEFYDVGDDYVRDLVYPLTVPATDHVFENTDEDEQSLPSIAIPTPEDVFRVNKPFAEQLLNQSAEARQEYISRVYDAVQNPARGRTAQDRARSVDENVERRKALPNTFPNTQNLPWDSAYDGVNQGTGTNTGSNTNTGSQTAGLDLTVPDVELDFSPLYASDLSRVFPFSIPFDLANFFNAFRGAPSDAPRWTVELYGTSVVIDLSPFEPLAKILRTFNYLAFVFSLILVSRKIIGTN